jgi:hypothetical protein
MESNDTKTSCDQKQDTGYACAHMLATVWKTIERCAEFRHYDQYQTRAKQQQQQQQQHMRTH